MFSDILPEHFPEDADNLLLEPINKYIKMYDYIKRGDIIHYGEYNYRNDNKLIWDGDKLEYLDYSLDEYGNLPSKYTLNEFTHKHFDNTIEHNNIRWIKLNNYSDIISINNISYKKFKNGKYFTIKITKDNITNTQYKILVPNNYLYIDTIEELYNKISNDESLDIKNNNNCLPLEIEVALLGLTDDEEMYIIYKNIATYD